MKKSICIIVLACIMALLPAMAFAIEHKADVIAEYEAADNIVIVPPSPEDEPYSTTIDDTTIEVELPHLGMRISLVIHQVKASEPEAFEWFESCSKSAGSMRLYYYIYFVDEMGNRVEINESAKVRITAPASFSEPTVHELLKQGELETIEQSRIGQTVEFDMLNYGYFVIASNVTQPDTPAPTEEPTPTPTPGTPIEPPKTGAKPCAGIAALVIMLMCALVIGSKKFSSLTRN